MKMLQPSYYPQHSVSESDRARRAATGPVGSRPLEAKVKRECAPLYPGVDPDQWYPVVQKGEYRDDMEGLWIQITERVTYVLGRHFDLQARPQAH
jgi:hypothetical protein